MGGGAVSVAGAGSAVGAWATTSVPLGRVVGAGRPIGCVQAANTRIQMHSMANA